MPFFDWPDYGQEEQSVASGRLGDQARKQISGLNGYSLAAQRDAALSELLASAMLGYGRRLTEFADLNEAVGAIGSTETVLLMNKASTVSADVTVPSTLALLWPGPGNVVTVNAGVTLTINGTIDAGLFQIFDASAGTFAFGGNSAEMFYPQWFGAAGDGATDDRAEVQAAADAAFSAGTTLCIGPEGTTFLVNTTTRVNFRSDVCGGGTLKAGSNWDGESTRLSFVESSTGSVTIKDIILDGNGLVPAFGVAGKDDVTLFNVEMKNASRALVELDRADNVKFLYCNLHGAGQDGNSSGASDVEHGDIIYSQVCEYLVVQNCEIHDYTRIGVVAEGNATNGDSLLPQVIGCQIHNAHDSTGGEFNSAVWYENCDGGQIIGNRCWDLHDATTTRSQAITVSAGAESAGTRRPYLILGNYIEGVETCIKAADSAVVANNIMDGGETVGAGKTERGINVAGGNISNVVVIVTGNKFGNFDLQQSSDSGASNLPDAIIFVSGTVGKLLISDNAVQNPTYTDTACGDITVKSDASVSELIIDNWINSADEARFRMQGANAVTDLTIRNSTFNFDGPHLIDIGGDLRLENLKILADAATSSLTWDWDERCIISNCEWIGTRSGATTNFNMSAGTAPKLMHWSNNRIVGNWNFRIADTLTVVLDGNVIEDFDGNAAASLFLGRSSGGDTFISRGTTFLNPTNSGVLFKSQHASTIFISQNDVINVRGSLWTGTEPDLLFVTGKAVTLNDTFEAFNAQDATPTVRDGRYFKTANTMATTITDFDFGETGQKIVVLIQDTNTTIDFTGTNLKGNGGSDWSPTTNDHMTCVYDGTNWYCDVSDNTA